MDLRRGRRGAWTRFDDTPVVHAEGIPASAQSRALIAEILEMVSEHVDEEGERHDLRITVRTTSNAAHESSPVAVLPRESSDDDGGILELGEGSSDRSLATILTRLHVADRKETREIIKACAAMASSVASSLSAIAMIHGVTAHNHHASRDRDLEHEEEMRRWDSVDRAADVLLSPVAEGLADFMRAKASAASAPVKPRGEAQKAIRILSENPKLALELGAKIGADKVSDISSAIRGAATAPDDESSWACWETALELIAPVQAELAPLLPAPLRDLLVRVYRAVQSRR